MAVEPINAPGDAELWRIDGVHLYLVYRIPGIDVPMLWHIENTEKLTALFGDAIPSPDRDLSSGDAANAGALYFGVADELANTDAHPFDTWSQVMETEAEVRPWMRDPEVMALVAQAWLEGREVTDAEFQTTEWWRTRTAEEREWASVAASDPARARRLLDDNREKMRQSLLEAGVVGAPDTLVRLLADNLTMGVWSGTQVSQQVRELADPFARGDLMPEVASLVDGVQLSRASDDLSGIRKQVEDWVGPAHAAAFTDEQLALWAGRIRNDPNAATEFEELLSGHRMALFPEYTNPRLRYADIAAPWEGVWSREWGKAADHSDPLFARIVRANDISLATQMLREEGMQRGNQTVVMNATRSLMNVVGDQVRHSAV